MRFFLFLRKSICSFYICTYNTQNTTQHNTPTSTPTPSFQNKKINGKILAYSRRMCNSINKPNVLVITVVYVGKSMSTLIILLLLFVFHIS